MCRLAFQGATRATCMQAPTKPVPASARPPSSSPAPCPCKDADVLQTVKPVGVKQRLRAHGAAKGFDLVLVNGRRVNGLRGGLAAIDAAGDAAAAAKHGSLHQAI